MTLKVVGYEYPDSSADYDRDWLMISIDVVAGPTQWSATDPALLTWELEALAVWFADLAQGKLAPEAEIGGIEPNLSSPFVRWRLDLILPMSSTVDCGLWTVDSTLRHHKPTKHASMVRGGASLGLH